MVLFNDRADAGRRLAHQLQSLRGRNVVVLGLPRGGVPVAAEVAAALEAPLDVIVVRKLGVPYQPEVAMGAIAEGGARVLNDEVIGAAGIHRDDVALVEERERAALERRIAGLRAGRRPVDLHGRTVVVVDDGIATGSTARAACQSARLRGAATVILAVPVAPPDTIGTFAEADEVVCLYAPEMFMAVGQFYEDFSATEDDDVVALLAQADQREAHRAEQGRRTGFDGEVDIAEGVDLIAGHLAVPPGARGVVIFAHGSGSSRHSPRNQAVAAALQRAGLGTLLIDLLTVGEEEDRAAVFDIELLANRLTMATRWLRLRPESVGCRIGYFGASTGAAAALVAAAELGDGIGAVVSRGGRPDLAGDRLPEVTAPTLLIVGGRDTMVLEANREAGQRLTCPSELSVVEGATHLFEEPGTLDQVAELARAWFVRHLLGPADAPG